jgi:hypothetical protein
MANLHNRFVEIDKSVGTACCAVGMAPRGVRAAKDRIKRVLREHVFDVGDQQFLMLLLMMETENQDWFDFIEQLFVRAGN